MAWYWWLLLIVVIVLIVRAQMNRRAPPQTADELFPFLARTRAMNSDVNQAVQQVAELITALPIVTPSFTSEASISRAEIETTVRRFLESKMKSGWMSETNMVHVVKSPLRITVFARLRSVKQEAALREFVRVADDQWQYRTAYVEDMQSAIYAAEQNEEY